MNTKYDLTEYVDRLYSAAIRKTGNSHIAEDLVQETFLAAFIAISKGKEPEHLWSWLLRILTNKYCDWMRDQYQRPQISFEEMSFDPAQELPPDDDSAQKLESIRRELGYLSKIHRQVLIRFYMRGDSVEKIAGELQISPGTVKSRLYTGRQHVREGVYKMETYAKQSYEPDTLKMACIGQLGLNGEPLTLVGDPDRLTQNVLLLAYSKPISEIELAKALGVPAAFVEPVVEKMTQSELMKRKDGGKVYTDFIIYTESDRKSAFRRQLEIASQYFELFWKELESARSVLQKNKYYKRQTVRGKSKLELHFCIKLLVNSFVEARNEVAGALTFSEYPYRQGGGRWFAMGLQYRPDENVQSEDAFEKYRIDGETSFRIKNFRNMKYLELRKYDTCLGGFPSCYLKPDYLKWFYELASNISGEDSSVDDSVLEAVPCFLENAILAKADSLKLDIPVMTFSEYQDECNLAYQYGKKLSQALRDPLRSVFDTGCVRLPSHLKSVPKGLQYMYCCDSMPMAVILKATEKGLFLANTDDPIPAAVLVFERA